MRSTTYILPSTSFALWFVAGGLFYQAVYKLFRQLSCLSFFFGSKPRWVGNGIASHFRHTGDGRLVIGCNERFCQPLDGRPPFAENDSLFRSLSMRKNVVDLCVRRRPSRLIKSSSVAKKGAATSARPNKSWWYENMVVDVNVCCHTSHNKILHWGVMIEVESKIIRFSFPLTWESWWGVDASSKAKAAMEKS